MRRAVVLSCVLTVLSACGSSQPTSGVESAHGQRRNMLASLPAQPPGTTILYLNISGVSLGSVATSPTLTWYCDTAGDSCGAYTTPGTLVTFTPNANSGAIFTSWGGQCSGNGPCQLTTAGTQSVLAVFQPWTVTVDLTGLGSGTVTSSYGTPICSGSQCVLNLNASAPGQLTLTAVPSAGSYFAGWFGAGCTGTSTCVVPTSQAQTVNAIFQPNQTAVTVFVPGNPVLGDGGGGSITATGTQETSCSVNGATTCTFHVNTKLLPVSVSLTATPNSYSAFSGWGGSCSGTGACSLNVTQATSVTAVFLAYELSVTVSGQGTVTSNPNVGLTCSTGTCTVQFTSSSPPILTLTATPAAGNSFVGWSGACSGTGTCQVSTSTPSNVVLAFFQGQGPGNGSPPIIKSFAANPSSIPAGGSSTLSWVVAGATGITVTGSATAGIGTINGSTVVVTPTFSPTTYTLTATNANGTSTALTTVTFTTPTSPTAYYHPDGWTDPTLTQQCSNMVQVGGSHACGGDMTFYMPGQCTTCHGNGSDFTPDGGSSNVSCAACHVNAFASSTCGGFGVSSPCSCDLCHGSVQMSPMMGTGCTLCHGNVAVTSASTQAAPPRDTLGNTATTAPFVGAHQSHLNAGAISQAIACTECHAVPTDITHAALPISFSWGPLATSAGVNPVWNGSPAYTCTNYCHGATLPGGTNTKPNWTAVNGTQAACGTCHGVPPPSPHPAAALTQCHGCHSGTVNADGTINVAGGLHVNGTVEITGGTCTSCHGNSSISTFPLNAAPPVDTLGNTATTFPGVGAHQAHLVNTNLRSSPIPCTECHVVPSDFTHSTEPLNLTWGPLASSNGAKPTFNATTHQCTNYCHGSTYAAGGSNTTPTWNVVNGTQDACGTCHGIPPPPSSGHPSLTDCGGCHCGYTSTSVNPVNHINASVDVDCE